MKTRRDFPSPMHYADYLLMFGTDEEKAFADEENRQLEREDDVMMANDPNVRSMYEKCAASPYYFFTTYLKMKTNLSEQEFNDIFNGKKKFINNDRRDKH